MPKKVVAGLLPVVLLSLNQVTWAGRLDVTVQRFASLHPQEQNHTLPVRTGSGIDSQGKHSLLLSSGKKNFYTSKRTGLPVLADGQVALPSNANNFHEAWKSSVNPRTGNVGFSLIVDYLLYSKGLNSYKFSLFYSGGPTANGPSPFDIGPHWTWNVGTEQPSATEEKGHRTTRLVLGDGHVLTMGSHLSKGGKLTWYPLRHKIKDVVVTGEPGNWTVLTSSGLREHIANGYEDWQETMDGQRLYFYYDKNGFFDSSRHLRYICPHSLTKKQLASPGEKVCGDGIKITYESNRIIVHGLQTITLHTYNDAGIKNIRYITMPDLSSANLRDIPHEPDRISFSYDDQANRPWLLGKIKYPTGLIHRFFYNQESKNTSHISYGLQTGFNGARLPVVTKEVTSAPGTPDQTVRYYYGANQKDEHNYTGYQGEYSEVPGRDNLADRPNSYTYSTSVDNGLTTSVTTFNKYHLPVSVEQRSDLTGSLLASNSKEYPEWRNTVFSDLPANFNMATRMHNNIYTFSEDNKQGFHPLAVKKEFRYDSQGKEVWRKNPDGSIIITQYCPLSGDIHCPKADESWPFASNVEKIVRVEAPKDEARNGLNADVSFSDKYAQEKIFDYVKLPIKNSKTNYKGYLWQIASKVIGDVPLSTINKEPGTTPKLPELQGGEITSKISYDYVRDSGSPTYAMLSQMRVTRIHRRHMPVVSGKRLRANMAMEVYKDNADTVIINIKNRIDPSTGFRSMTLTTEGSADKGLQKLVGGAGGLVLGESIYSLRTGKRLKTADSMKQRNVTWYYDLWNRPAKMVTTPSGDAKPQATTWQYIVTPEENAVIITTPLGNQKKIEYSARGQKVGMWHRFFDHASMSLSGGSGWIRDARITWTPYLKPESVTVWHAADPVDGKAGKAVGMTTNYGYDDFNRQIWTQNPDKSVSVTVPDDAHKLTITYGVIVHPADHTQELRPLMQVKKNDLAGNITDLYSIPLGELATRHGHDIYNMTLRQELGRMISHMLPIGRMRSTHSHGLLRTSEVVTFVKHAINNKAWLTHVQRQYDGFGRVIKQINAKGAVTRWKYESGKLVATITPDNRVIHDAWNVYSKKTGRCVTTPGSHECHVLGQRGYDNSGNLVWRQDEYGNRTYYGYDADGRVTWMKTPADADAPRGHRFAYHYNSFGVTEKFLDGHLYAKYTYDPLTGEVSDKYDAIAHTHFSYSRYTGDLKEVAVTPAKGEAGIVPDKNIHYPAYTKRFTWNRFGMVTSMTDAMGNRYTQKHDSLGRVVAMLVQSGKDNTPRVIETFSYDDFGRIHGITNGIGIQRTFIYNSMGMISDENDELDGKYLQKRSFVWDTDTMNLVDVTWVEGGHSATSHYTYDKVNNLTSMSCHQTGTTLPDKLCPRETGIGHSGPGVPPVITEQRYFFDKWNNIKRVKEEVVSEGKHLTKTSVYTYAGENQLNGNYDPHRMTGFNSWWSNQKASEKPELLAYDNLGRIIRDTSGNRLHYNAFGQMDSFVNVATHETTRYIYNSDQKQVAEQSFSSLNQPLQNPLYLFYSGVKLVGKAQSVNGVLHKVSWPGSISRSVDGHINAWYLHDYRGDVTHTFDEHGKLVSYKVYSPYGMSYDLLDKGFNQLAHQPVAAHKPWITQDNMGFDGQRTDPATGYQFLGAGYRAYNPVYRHFMSSDSFAPFNAIDGYGFAENNPIMNADPSGHLTKMQIIGFITGSASMAAALASAVLMPAALFAAGTTGWALLGGSIVIWINSVFGVGSGALGITSSAYPKNKSLVRSNDIVGVVQGLLGFIPVTALQSIFVPMNLAQALSKGAGYFRVFLKGLIINATWSATITWGYGTFVSGWAAVGDFYGKLSRDKRYQKSLDILNYIFTVGAFYSLGSSIISFGVAVSGKALEKGLTGKGNNIALKSESEAGELENVVKGEKAEPDNEGGGKGSGISVEKMGAPPEDEGVMKSAGMDDTVASEKEAAKTANGLSKLRNFTTLSSMGLMLSGTLGVSFGGIHIVEAYNMEAQANNKSPGQGKKRCEITDMNGDASASAANCSQGSHGAGTRTPGL